MEHETGRVAGELGPYWNWHTPLVRRPPRYPKLHHRREYGPSL